MGGSVDAVRERLVLGKKEVLTPLLNDLTSAAPLLAEQLSGEERRRAEGLPAALQGQLQEVDSALDKGLMLEYTSSATGQVYKCGKLESALEAVVLTVEEF